MSPPNGGQNGSAHGYYSALSKPAATSGSTHTITALKRWSIINKQLPGVKQIKAIHVYDFDNTLFKTPLPNPQIWNGPTIGQLSNPDIFTNGGWWHDSRILAATGGGHEKEEPKAWEGWWNEKIVELVRLSQEQPDALTVLLTGRSESGFSELIKRMVAAKKLDFDLISLKPPVGPANERFSSTMHFKQMFLKALMETYKHAEEIRIYEDRIRHVKGFRDFLADYNKVQNGIGGRPTRGPISAEVIMVPDQATTLDPVAEVAEVQHLINEHNEHVTKNNMPGQRLTIKKTVFYTGYLIDAADSQRLLTLAQIPAALKNDELKYHANNIMITPKSCPPQILKKVGGIGAKMTWEVTGTACFENSIWAASVQPVPATARFHTDNPSPFVVLALRRGAKPIDATRIQNWQPVPPDKAFVFETVVREKVLLRIEREDSTESPYESLFVNKSGKRKHDDNDNGYGRGGYGGPGAEGGRRHYHTGRGGAGQGQFRGGRGGGGGRGNFRGGRGGAPKGPRGGRGGGHHYKSLDDAVAKENQGGFKQQVSYEDYPPLPQQGQQQQHQQVPQIPQAPAAFYNQQQQQAQYQAPYQQQQQYGGWQAPQQGGQPPQQQQGQGRPAGGAGYGAGGADIQNYY
ncbi:hypothetical protein CONLIGDRAFT_580629 [Coniochaeta ligniaria NRRL 30616]|uniref:Swiss Army Knife RNA repair protein HAD domain-containing protein n=1 Tax=Coniochaeta ligniaria NRRL 30616 TaxID=1408157 RepID=A0A1J7IFD1_9PEZI|nr:hypothetical protein CONLIGDRAFT_580629 [Coniochaeta ligniaria NRRL 30616]